MAWVNSTNLFIMQKTLDGLWTRNKIISNNIANIDTPGFKSKSVEFEKIIDSIISSGSNDNITDELKNTQPKIVSNNNTSIREDGNNVDIEAENIELARVQIQYEYMTRQLTNEFSRLKYVINEGRR